MTVQVAAASTRLHARLGGRAVRSTGWGYLCQRSTVDSRAWGRQGRGNGRLATGRPCRASLVGHATTRTTGIVHRRELRPVITTGAEIMDQLFTAT